MKVLASHAVASQEGSLSNFGLLIAYVLPGFTAFQGLPLLSHASTSWGTGALDQSPSVASFLSGTIEALAMGLIVSTVRWLLIDALHHRTGIHPPAWDFARLEKNVGAFEYLVQVHYRYYKFYANMVVALAWAFAAGGYAQGWRGLVYGLLAGLFLIASRDALRKYYERAGQLLRPLPEVSTVPPS
jgi:hypothetical protein